MNDTQLQQYISAHNRQVELIESLRKQIKELEDRSEKEIDAVISAFTFINSEVQDFIDGEYKGSKNDFRSQSYDVLARLHNYVTYCNLK